jgi:hypothetical protein
VITDELAVILTVTVLVKVQTFGIAPKVEDKVYKVVKDGEIVAGLLFILLIEPAGKAPL